MEIGIKNEKFMEAFDKVWTKPVLNKNKLNLFVLKINANEFNYELLEERLIDPMINYSVSRMVREKYRDEPGTLSKKARQKFRTIEKNTGELGELLLYAFLEAHLKAPKILSKLEMKTSNNMYINGSDAVHFLKLDNGNFQLIFGESKMYKKFGTALDQALESISNFKKGRNANGDAKTGMQFEKTIISDNLCKEVFSEEEKKFIESIIYPKEDTDFYTDDAFGIFIGYEINITEEEKMLENGEFRNKVKGKIDLQISKQITKIESKIKEKNLTGHNFYIYVLPFTEIDKKRVEILNEVLS